MSIPHIIYEGQRLSTGCSVTWQRDPEPAKLELPPRLGLVRKSPDGFEWGYNGSGPAQLALALLAHAFHEAGLDRDVADRKARLLFQYYKEAVVVKLPRNQWTLRAHDVLKTAYELEDRFINEAK